MQRVSDTVERISVLSAPVVERLTPGLAVAQSCWSLAFPYLVKAFRYGFIPFVLMLGMRTEPRPKLLDLLTPM